MSECNPDYLKLSHKVLVITADAGRAHMSCACVLTDILRGFADTEVITIDAYQHTIPTFRAIPRFIGKKGERLYNEVILKRWRTFIGWPLLCLGIITYFAITRHMF